MGGPAGPVPAATALVGRGVLRTLVPAAWPSTRSERARRTRQARGLSVPKRLFKKLSQNDGRAWTLPPLTRLAPVAAAEPRGSQRPLPLPGRAAPSPVSLGVRLCCS